MARWQGSGQCSTAGASPDGARWGLTVLTIIARNGYGRANPLRCFRRLLPPRGSTSGVAAPRARRCERCKAKIETGVSGGSFGGDGNSQGGGVKGSGRTLDYERTFGSGVCSLSGSTMTKCVRCSWSKSVSASITSLGGASAITSRIRSAITVDSWSARSKTGRAVPSSEPSVIRTPALNAAHK